MPVSLQSLGVDLSDVDQDAQNAFNAIAAAENVPAQYNNPLALQPSQGDGSVGTFGAGIAIFPTPQAGAQAGIHQVQLMESNASGVYSSDESIADVGASYAPNQPAWISNVAAALGVSPTSPLFGNTTAQANSGNVVSDAVSGSISAATNGAASTITGYIGQYLGRAVAIGLGLLLIAAGVFSFDKVQTVVVGAAREGARAAVA